MSTTTEATVADVPGAAIGGPGDAAVDQPLDPERQALLVTLAMRRDFLRRTVQAITEEQARLRPTASELCLAGIVKHVAAQEEQWIDFMVNGTSAIPDFDPSADQDHWADEFTPGDDETLEVLLARYGSVAERTERAVAEIADLGDSHALPKAPWFPPGARWSARDVVLHVIGEIAQHSGHADVIRESIDGAKTMG